MISLENIAVKFDRSLILHDISMRVGAGEIVGIIGPNGCGKTTLLNAISGFVEIENGSITFGDEDISEFNPYQRVKMGIGRSFQTVGIFREMTVEENLMMALEHAKNYPWWWKFSKKFRSKVAKEIEQLLNEVDLSAHKHSIAGVLSGGQLRLLELLRLKVSGGSLLLIDEPTAGVSPVMKKHLSKMIRELRHHHERSLVIVEHDLKFLFELVDRVIVLVDGRIFMEGTPEEVSKNQKLQEVYFGNR
jgi:branched-chain amino acid transport system ATP-binding protein